MTDNETIVGLLRELQTDYKLTSRDIGDVKILLAEVNKEVAFHIKRTEQLESQYFLLAEKYGQLAQQFSRWKGAVALSGWIFGAAFAVFNLVLKFYL